jgi:hypothetical protein
VRLLIKHGGHGGHGDNFFALRARIPISLSVLSVFSVFSSSCAGPGTAVVRNDEPAKLDRALERATTYLLNQQSTDGAWHSEKYRALADGRALTPMILSALLFAPRRADIRPAYDRGVDYVATLARADGSLDEGEYGLNYPVYALSGALLVLSVPVNARHERAKQALIEHLRVRQLDEARGWASDDPSYGGWGYYPALPDRAAPPNVLLSSNITSTLFAIGALQLAGVGLEEASFGKARVFIERCQNQDGGFFFTPANEVQNKAGDHTSYGTATADGLRALLRLGVARDDRRVLGAAKWLLSRFRTDRSPGEFPPEREVERASSYYYWTWTAAHALMLLGPVPQTMAEANADAREWPRRLADALVRLQRADGSWRNDAGVLFEDDPLVGTSLAFAALAICRAMLRAGFETSIAM